MFWGVIIEPNGSFESMCEDILHITHVCVQEELKDEKMHRAFIKIDNEEVCIASITGNNLNYPVSVIVEPEHSFTLLNKTQNVLYISGYTIAQNKLSPEMEDSLVIEKQQLAKSRKSEKRKSVVAPKKPLSPASKKIVRIGGVEKSIPIESYEERLKKQNRRQRFNNAFI
ncbi:hypothetical protein ENU1_027280 [Entamoeba nuttalli P19]|uniref:Nucleoplasmin-like domain-containing protein n=1 Tax=Entamoeba nuttalli (strain P19) TaxID=1076696 RepID=K2HH58_ENTNP|nr:hypothetical protein ENU1_027280 [Entamoeba nuttalli P19]EKE42254.1 hypothetical protein ENU1_027280 [Entamoeba nuttalli P19]|eukprot:XP_008855407.1 hypothetical protein ENU1_027280 [Entamoeba nuttalli P19]